MTRNRNAVTTRSEAARIYPEPIVLPLHVCPVCGFEHPTKSRLSYPEVAGYIEKTVSTLYSMVSRGTFPPASTRKGISPQWSSCVVARWLFGREVPE
jgi:predicted DNA-binding transcriptional regulator AlpA